MDDDTKPEEKPAASREKVDVDAAEPAAEWVSITALKPWEDNPRNNDGEPVKKVMESIKRFGFASPIIARKADGEVIAGHTRLKAAEALGLDKVPVRYVDLDPADAHLLALADNRIGEAAVWDVPKLQEVMSGFGLQDIEVAGWSSDDLEAMASGLLGGGDEGGADDESGKLKNSFDVIVACSTEEEQLQAISVCQENGLPCRALT